jgi:GNAT superfamily N-acetyltransferase
VPDPAAPVKRDLREPFLRRARRPAREKIRAMPEIAVRPAAPEDAPVLADFNRRLALESEGLELDPATVAAGVAALLADPAKGCYFVAEEGGEPVGQVMLTVEWSDWRNGPVFWLQSVYVRPDRRGAGVFRRLWEQVVSFARDRGARALRLYVDRDNRAAQDVYRRVGMAPSHYQVYELEHP